MLDIKKIRVNADEVIEGLKKRGITGVVEKIQGIDEKRRELIVKTEGLKAKRNEVSKQIPKLKKEGKDVSDTLLEMKKVAEDIKEIDADLAVLDKDLESILLATPNLPHEDVPIGDSDEDNIEQRKWGEPRSFEFEPKAHWDIGTGLGILDFETAGKVTGARFTFYKGLDRKSVV